MTNKFKNKGTEEIADDIFNASSAADVDSAFKTLESVDADARKKTVDALEKLVVDDTLEMAAQSKLLGPASGLEKILTQYEEEGDLATEQSNCQIFLHVSQIKGDEAHLVTKAIVKELSTLSDADYNSLPKLTIAVINATNKATAATAKAAPKTPNPFKNKGPSL